MSLYVIGVDPGETTGVVGIAFRDAQHPIPPAVFQTTSEWAVDLVGWLVDGHLPSFDVAIAVERFVVGNRAARSRHAGAGRTTRELVEAISGLQIGYMIQVVQQSAGQVKPWAVDSRLEAAGLLGPCSGMRHAKDAARHALFAATRSFGQPDPLSKKARRS